MCFPSMMRFQHSDQEEEKKDLKEKMELKENQEHKTHLLEVAGDIVDTHH